MTSRKGSSATPGPGRGGGGRTPRGASGRTTGSGASSTGPSSTRRTALIDSDATAARIGRGRGTLTGRAAVLLLVLAVLGVSYASSVRAWLTQRGEINELNVQIAEQQADVQELRETRQRWKDPAYVEAQARLRFGWLMPGETGFRVIGPDGEVLSDGGSRLTEPGATDDEVPQEWWQDQWESVVEAGKDPMAPQDEQQPDRDPVERIGRNRDQRQDAAEDTDGGSQRRRDGAVPSDR